MEKGQNSVKKTNVQNENLFILQKKRLHWFKL